LSLLLFSIALSSSTTGYANESNNKAVVEKYAAAHSDETVQHSVSMSRKTATAYKVDTDEIGRNADDLPPPIKRTDEQLVVVDLYTDELVAEMMPGVAYQYWTYNGKVPGPFIRVRAGDQVEIHLNHGKPGAAGVAHNEHTSTQHAAEGHSTHSIDLHAVIGPGGGAPLMQVGQGEEKRFRLKQRIRAFTFITAQVRMCQLISLTACMA